MNSTVCKFANTYIKNGMNRAEAFRTAWAVAKIDNRIFCLELADRFLPAEREEYNRLHAQRSALMAKVNANRHQVERSAVMSQIEEMLEGGEPYDYNEYLALEAKLRKIA